MRRRALCTGLIRGAALGAAQLGRESKRVGIIGLLVVLILIVLLLRLL